ncbi:MAG: hypothetical protein ACRDKD_10860, partial [Solirubrobacteraceae bacterium]
MPDHVPLSGSARPVASGAQRVRDIDPDERLEVTVTLSGPALPETGVGQPLTREQLERDHGTDPNAIAQVTRALEGVGLRVDEASPLTRS